MTDNGDQKHLNAVVDDCYGGQWPWRKGDVYYYEGGDTNWLVIVASDLQASTENAKMLGLTRIPLAGTWVIGSLIEKMGERFSSLMRRNDETWGCYIKHPKWDDGETKGVLPMGDTPIQALCAALRAVLKEGDHNELSTSKDKHQKSLLR